MAEKGVEEQVLAMERLRWKNSKERKQKYNFICKEESGFICYVEKSNLGDKVILM